MGWLAGKQPRDTRGVFLHRAMEGEAPTSRLSGRSSLHYEKKRQ